MTPAQLAAKLREQAARLRDLTPALRVFGEVVKDLMVDSYSAQSSPGGDAWAPNKPSTVKRKGSSRAGMDKGYTRASLTARVNSEGNGIEFGTNRPNAGPVFFGFTKAGTLRRRKAPRPAGTPYSYKVPGRNPLPIKDGKWDNRGRSASALARLGAIIVEFVRTGRAAG